MYNKDGMNKLTDELFQKTNYKIINSNENINFSYIYKRLYYYTKYRDKRFVPTNIKEIIKNIGYDGTINYYNDDNIYFKFLLLSDYAFLKKRKKELTSDRRLHKCHGASYDFMFNFSYDKVYLLTGFINISNHDILHSVVEIEDDESSRIVDYTQNLVMKKEDYIRITNFKCISKISKQDIIDDKDKISPFNMKLAIYLFFRDELMKDLKKNEKVLKLNN
ncbi:MAG: hypothetical protein IJ105_03535 [Bacilli bacterium]|nr:hypothetical protein [Bacilli bacterium]